MSAEWYTIDTNILVYAVDHSEGWKHEIAARIVDASVERPCLLTAQALAEFVSVATRKRKRSVPEAVAQARDWLRLFPVVAADAKALEAAYQAIEARRFGLWDALLLATAGGAGCTLALSEDMQNGRDLAGIVVRNPFVTSDAAATLQARLGVTWRTS